jgi:hypothetical protein
VIVRPAPARFGSEAWRLLHGLDGVLEREQAFGLVLDLAVAGRGACVLVETALAERASPIAARCVGAATVGAPQSGMHRRLAQHPILFPFPSVSKPSVDEAVAWVAGRLEHVRKHVRPGS